MKRLRQLARSTLRHEPVDVLLLELSANGRYLVDGLGRPFLVKGDAAWSLIAQLSGSDLTTYLNSMAALGVNTLLVNLFEHFFSDNPPENAAGVAPFSSANDVRTLNASYFNQVRLVLDACLARNIVVMLTPIYYGINGDAEGWYDAAFDTRTQTELENFARAIVAQIGTYPNLIWVFGGDYSPASMTKTNAFAAALKAADPLPHLATFHGDPFSTTRTVSGIAAFHNINAVYPSSMAGQPSNDDSAPGMTHAYGQSPVEAWFDIEQTYEGAVIAPTLQWLHEQIYGAILGGGFGSIPGVEHRWQFDALWEGTLTSALTGDYAHIGTLFDSRRWYDLVPSLGAGLVSAGRGTEGADAYTTAAITADGRFAVLYCANTNQRTVVMTNFAGTVTGRWFNPSDGSFAAASGSPFANTGTQNFTPPGADRLLVLEA